jgi:hypothetical protein
MRLLDSDLSRVRVGVGFACTISLDSIHMFYPKTTKIKIKTHNPLRASK